MKTSIYFQNPLKVLILKGKMVGLGGLEPPTSPLSGVRSNQAELQTQSCLHKLTKCKSSEEGL
jgi:hypothetical protein